MLIIYEVEAFKYFSKVMGARPEKTNKKLKVKKTKNKTKESLRSKKKETQRETTFSSMKCEFMILLYLFSVFVFYIWIQLTCFSLFRWP